MCLQRLSIALLFTAAASCGPEDLPRMNTDGMSVEQMLSVCSSGSTLPGIDVSHWDGTINWATVAGTGGVKWAYAKATEHTTYEDTTFAANWAGMKAHGVAR